MDKNLTGKEKEREVEHIKYKSEIAAKKLLEETQKKNEKLLEKKEESHQEHVKQLIKKMEEDRAQLIAERERILTLKLQELLLLQEGFQEESMKLKKEMKNMEKRNAEKLDHMKAEYSQTTARLEEMQEKYELKLGNRDRPHQKHVQQFNDKMEWDRAQPMAERDKAMTLELQDQHFKEELLQGRRKYEKEIQDREMKNREINKKLESTQADSAQNNVKMEEKLWKLMHMLYQKEKTLEDRVEKLNDKLKKEKVQRKQDFQKLQEQIQKEKNSCSLL